MPEVAIELEGENGCLPFLMQRIAEQGHAVVVVAEGIHSTLCFAVFSSFFPSLLLSFSFPSSRINPSYPNSTIFMLYLFVSSFLSPHQLF